MNPNPRLLAESLNFEPVLNVIPLLPPFRSVSSRLSISVDVVDVRSVFSNDCAEDEVRK